MRLGGRTRESRSVRRHGFDRPRMLWVVTGATLTMMFVPVIVVVAFSFNAVDSLVLLDGLSLRWYSAVLADSGMLSSLRISLQIALISSALAVVVGTALAFGIHRSRSSAGRTTHNSVLLRVVTPETASGASLLLFFTQAGFTLSTSTVVLGHLVLSLAFVTVIIHSRLVLLNVEMEQAAMDLGATRLQAVWLVAIPLLRPAIIASGLLAFVLSFDNFITSFFTTGVGTPPLPVRIYSMIRYGVTPAVNALGVLMLGVTLLAIALAGVLALAAKRRSRFFADTETSDGV